MPLHTIASAYDEADPRERLLANQFGGRVAELVAAVTSPVYEPAATGTSGTGSTCPPAWKQTRGRG